MKRGRFESAGRYWNLPVVLCCPKTVLFLEYLEMRPTWGKIFKSRVFQNLSNLLSKNLISIYF